MLKRIKALLEDYAYAEPQRTNEIIEDMKQELSVDPLYSDESKKTNHPVPSSKRLFSAERILLYN